MRCHELNKELFSSQEKSRGNIKVPKLSRLKEKRKKEKLCWRLSKPGKILSEGWKTKSKFKKCGMGERKRKAGYRNFC